LRWVVTGSRGQLGRALVARLADTTGQQLLAAPDHASLDIADPSAVKQFFAELPSPADVVVNAAALTHVDRCETETEAARRVNGVAPALLAEACLESGCRLVHVSTDYVFAGDAQRPYAETDSPAPRTAYGRSKLEGERRVLAASDDFLVARTSWVFGQGRNFVGAVLARARALRGGAARDPLRVVDDQRGRPTYAVDLAEALVALVELGARGLYHVANGGVATWWELARAALDEAGFADLEIERVATGELDLPAPRPLRSVLDCSKAEALGVCLRSWRDALRAYLRSGTAPVSGRT
jgi:dTDP-4-dehydrorhamnose reductase